MCLQNGWNASAVDPCPYAPTTESCVEVPFDWPPPSGSASFDVEIGGTDGGAEE
jgi:hypothetical protein